MVIAGIGCRADCPAEDIVAVLHDAGTRLGRPLDAVALPDFKADAAGPRAAALRLELPVLRVMRADLEAVQALCPTRSQAAARAVGVASVAEGCALAAAGPGGRLLLPRIAHARATCAVAEG